MNKRRMNIYVLAAMAMMIALVFVSNYLSIPIPTPVDQTRLHLANVMCLLSALLLGKWRGGLAAGLGSMFYDFTIPAYASEFWITFINKFLMAFICGLIVYGFVARKDRKPKTPRLILGAAAGALSYVVLYLTTNFIKNHLVFGYELETVLMTLINKGVVSLINGAIAVPAALLLYVALRPALVMAGLGQRVGIF